MRRQASGLEISLELFPYCQTGRLIFATGLRQYLRHFRDDFLRHATGADVDTPTVFLQGPKTAGPIMSFVLAFLKDL
jgi:hypothetical protein